MQKVPFAEAFEEKSRGVKKIKQKDYLKEGTYPVIDQSQNQIGGYYSDKEGLFTDVPIIVFGDHTRCVKYVDTPFFAGADGVKILKPKLSNNVRFWYHALRSTQIEDLGYSRHYKLLKQSSFCLYNKEQEKAICEILDFILKQIEIIKNQLNSLDFLVKSRFVEMFGDPISTPFFRKVNIDKLAKVSSGATPSRKRPEYYEGTIPWVKTGEVAAGDIFSTEEHITEEAIANSACHLLPRGTVLIAMYGQGDTRGKAALLMIEAATNQACAALEFESLILPVFALVHLEICYEDLRTLSHGGNQKNLNLQIIKKYKLEVPPLSLQQEFADFVAQVDKSRFVNYFH